jgi:hypothetical protein
VIESGGFDAKKNFVVDACTGLAPNVHSFSTDRLRAADVRTCDLVCHRPVLVWTVAVRGWLTREILRRMAGGCAVWLVVCAPGATFATSGARGDAGDASDPTLLRVFLTNGASVVSYGEYARVGDRVVFSMQLAPAPTRSTTPPGTEPPGAANGPTLHLVNLPASLVDWAATERYADSMRYARYVAARGDLDYAALNNQISRVLAEIAATGDAGRRLELALGARKILAEWPATHYGYRSHDVAQISSLLDEVISELRAETGGTAFELSFVAAASPPEPVSPLPVPTEREGIEQAIVVAHLTDIAEERMSLLESIAAALRAPGAEPAAEWRATTVASVTAELAEARKTEAAYQAVSSELMRSATRYARRGDVAGVERVIESVARRDRLLGRKRPDQVRALVGALQGELENAQRVRLVLDRWELRFPLLQKYERIRSDLLEGFESVRPQLDEIRRLAGPSDLWLSRILFAAQGAAQSLRLITPPDELVAAHSLALSALDLAANAARGRREAVQAGSLDMARDASSAAAGALMLMDRARADIEAAMKSPVILERR